ncbi:KPTN-like protein [Mya arenaria]|uniref:KPTN-like protein n=1 Tax=Mya arenaria TaxID=6604 RepID=A0ABY7F7U0_MYAAR|nr:KICSTOR complex protein kaptin-like [Mya arenaria]WAR18243.1 KPTN-like protein [Mya arenaria]
MEQRKWKWTDAHFCSIPSQTTIYGCTKITNNGTNKLLVASLDGRFFTMEYQRIFDKLTPSSKQIQFTYIPGEAEIVSVDAINKCLHGDGLIIGITFWKTEENEWKQFLHLYSATQPGDEFCLESVAQGCQSLELNFMPFHLTHSEIIVDGMLETVFLLSGSDCRVHLYREVNNQHRFQEADSDHLFPELKDLPSVVMWLDIHYYDDNKRRITVTGHQDGLLNVSFVNVQTREVDHQYKVEFDNPVTYVVTFSLTNTVPRPSFLPGETSTYDHIPKHKPSVPELNILILSALIPATIYRDVLRHGLRDPIFLPDSNKFDALLTGCIIDIDFDGENEILVGTYGQKVLAYKMNSSRIPRLHKSSSTPDTDLDFVNSAMAEMSTSLSKNRHHSSEEEYGTYLNSDSIARRVRSQENLSASLTSDADYSPLSTSKDTVIASKLSTSPLKSLRQSPSRDVLGESSCRLLWQRGFPCPVMGINKMDIMGDGMEDLVIVTLKGLHILQPDLTEVSSVVLERLRILASEFGLNTKFDSDNAHRTSLDDGHVMTDTDGHSDDDDDDDDDDTLKDSTVAKEDGHEMSGSEHVTSNVDQLIEKEAENHGTDGN